MRACPICGKAYARNEHLKRHINSAHSPGATEKGPRKKYRCECGRGFTRSDALIRHQKKHIVENNPDITADQGGDVSLNGDGDLSMQSAMSASEMEGNASTSFAESSRREVSFTPSNTSTWTDQQPFPMQQQQSAPTSHIPRQDQQQQSLDAQEYPIIPELNLMPGLSFVDNTNAYTNLTDQYFSGLDWIFDDLTETSSEPPMALLEDQWNQSMPPVTDESRPAAYDNDDIFGGADTTRDTTETLNLLNLANAALFVPNVGQSRGPISQSRTPTRYKRQSDGQIIDVQASKGDEEDASWPQEFRPIRKKPPTIELSAFTLAFDTPENGRESRPDQLIMLDEYEEEEHSETQWQVSQETRQNLLNYLTHSCRHPWSIYSFSSTPPASFLSTSQLEKLVHLFFSKFHPRVPILHAPTFDPAAVPPILLLSVVTIGLVFYPSEINNDQNGGSISASSLHQLRKCTSTLSVAFSELVRIGVMSAYEADQRGFTNVSINQAWILQQMFGVGSGDKRLYKIAERNRGGLLTAVRRLGLLYQTKESNSTPIDNLKEEELADTNTLQSAWRGWIAKEARLRLGWFVYLHDQLFSCYLDVAPMFRYTEISASLPCHADLWSSEDANLWLQRYRKNRIRSHPKSLLPPLRQLLRPSNPPLPLQLNQLEAYILAVTLYAMRWESCKQRILFDGDGKEADITAEKALEKLSEAASIPAWKQMPTSNTPLAIEVQLLHLLANLHFCGPPIFFDRLRDAAGRSGITSARRLDAIKWLQEWMSSSTSSQIAMRRMLLASAQLYDLVFNSLNNASGAKSFVSAIAIFHAALCMWAFIQFSPQNQVNFDNHNFNTIEERRQLARLSPFLVTAIRERGVLSLPGRKSGSRSTSRIDEDEYYLHEDGFQNGLESSYDDLIQAWIHGKYISTQNDQIYDWPLSPLAVSIDGIGTLNQPISTARGNGNGSRASTVLDRFARLLARLNWGLAASFRLILLHMARHASQ